jgi:hypothetical protein
MVKKKMNLGEMAFLGGMALAVILGIGSSFLPVAFMPFIMAILACFGLIVGFLNISEKEVVSFLIATIALLAVSSAINPITAVLASVPAGPMMVQAIGGFFAALAAFIAPAAFVVAIKSIYGMARVD